MQRGSIHSSHLAVLGSNLTPNSDLSLMSGVSLTGPPGRYISKKWRYKVFHFADQLIIPLVSPTIKLVDKEKELVVAGIQLEPSWT